MSTQQSPRGNAPVIEESEPLLPGENGRRTSRTRLPKLQITALCVIRLVDPIAFTQIFPYVNEMILNLHLSHDESSIGFYSGILESSFALAQVVCIYHWGRLSDLVGRRPVIFASILGLARVLIGLFSGSVAVIHTVVGELTDSTNASVAFPIFGMVWPIGAIIGPLIGGSLANPADVFPRLFDSPLWHTYPYFLPCLVTAAISVFAMAVGYLWLSETHPDHTRAATLKRDPSPAEQSGIGSEVPATGPVEPPTLHALLSTPSIRAVSLSGFAFSLVQTAHAALFPLFCYSSVHSGGLGLSVQQIGYSLSVAAGASVAIQIVIIPRLLRTFPTARLYNAVMAFWPVAFALLPALHIVARRAEAETREIRAALWIGIAVALLLSRIGTAGYALNMILVKEVSPTPAHLVGANSLNQIAMCLSRALAPALISSLYALTADRAVLGGCAWAAVMVFLSIVNCYAGTWIIHGREVALEEERN